LEGNNMAESISRREAARRHGINEATIRKHIDSGGLAAAVLPNGKLDAAKVAALLPTIITRGAVAPVALTSARNRRLRAQVAVLGDTVEGLQRAFVPVAASQRIAISALRPVREHLGRISEAAKSAAGLPAKVAHDHIRTIIHNALAVISREALGRGEVPWWDEPVRHDVDLAKLSANDLLAQRANLQAVKLEVEHMVERGDVRPVRELVAEMGERLTVAKSLLVAIPARVAPQVPDSTASEVHALVAAEIDGVLAQLQ
jgi:hypothetical protein